jgi:hypothetical protein
LHDKVQQGVDDADEGHQAAGDGEEQRNGRARRERRTASDTDNYHRDYEGDHEVDELDE